MTVRTICAGLSVLCVGGVLAAVVANSGQSTEAALPVGSPDQSAPGARRAISGPVCGDMVCDAIETCVSCQEDCGECDPPIVEVVVRDSTGPDNPLGTKSCQVLLHLNAPADQLLAVGNADISTDDPDGFFQQPHEFFDFGGPTSPPCVPFIPDPVLPQDSYVTLGVECDDGSDSTNLVPLGFDEVLFNTEGRLLGGWFNFDPGNEQGLPDAEGNVLIAQFTVGEFHNTCGTLTAFVGGDFGLPALACPDLDGSKDVRVPDMIILLGSWGSCPGCPADFNGDDEVDILDLIILLSSWGPCDKVSSPGVGFPVSFECPGFPCFQEIPTISKWSQLPHGAQEGFNVASDVDWQTLDEQPSGSPGPGPNWVVADDFVSDGRPIIALRWWGSYLDPAFEPGMSMSVQGPSSTDPIELLPSGTRAAMLGTNCCEAHGGNGCDDQECQDLVCAGNALCCFDPPIGGWIQSCADSALGLCTICGASDCCITNPTPGCDDPSCESIVCAQDRTCCDTQWGINCLLLALANCHACIPGSTCGDPAAGDCCTANGTTGCDDDACCNAVCNADSSCCSGAWTQACADAAQASPFCTCEIGPVCPGEGNCFNPNPTPGCQDANCCETVCAALPSCCEGAWDDACAEAALDSCDRPEVDGWLISFHAEDPALDHPDRLLGLYSCPAAAVQVTPTEIFGWDGHRVYEYVSTLENCCRLHYVPDLRDKFSEVPPAQPEAFREVAGFVYWLDIQAVVGHTFEENEGDCTLPVDTTNRADDHFWGWHTSAFLCRNNSAMGEVVMGPSEEWVYQNWSTVDGSEHMLEHVDQAYELLTVPGSCKWDFTGAPLGGPDGQTRVPDLIALLANWGPYDTCELERFKVMDFNANGTVRVPDLIEMLANWGRCECNNDALCPSNDCGQDGLCVPLE